jgi:hypothetical protein
MTVLRVEDEEGTKTLLEEAKISETLRNLQLSTTARPIRRSSVGEIFTSS